MADVTVTVDSSQVVQAAGQINDLVASGQKISAGLAKFGLAPEAAKTRMSPEDLRALEAYEASLKKVSGATDELDKTSQRAGINIGGMFERMAVRMGILLLIHEAIKAVIQAFQEAAAEETSFVQIQNMTAQSNEQTYKTFEGLKQIAHDTGQDLEKTVVPAFIKFREAGFDPEEAQAFDRVVSTVLTKTGTNLTDIAIKAQIGAASFADIAKAANALGDVALGKWAQSWMAAGAAEKSYEQDLARNHELTQRAVQDAERLAGAHEEFASSTGLASAAFEAFRKVQIPAHGAIAARVEIPKALADLPGGHQAFGQLLGEMQKRYGEGIRQIAKEENLPAALVRAGVAAGISGFDEKSLLTAQKRGLEEQNLARTRKEQDERYERTKAFEDARVNANKLVTTEMNAQLANTQQLDKVLSTVNGQTKQLAGSWREMASAAGDIVHGFGGLLSGRPAAGPGESAERTRALGFAALQPYLATPLAPLAAGMFARMAQPGAAGAQAGEKVASEGGLKAIVDEIKDLKNMLRGHG